MSFRAESRAASDKHRHMVSALLALLTLLCALTTLFWGENIGVSDNGDFRRVMVTNGLEYSDPENASVLFKEEYVMELDGGIADLVKSHDEDMYSSPHFLFVRAAKVINYLINIIWGGDPAYFHIRYLGGLYAVMLAAAAFCIFESLLGLRLWQRLLAAAVFIFVFCDSGYLAYFNSLYGEPLQMTSLLLGAGLGALLYQRPTPVRAVLFYAVLFLFSGAKLANIPLGILAGLLGAGAFLRRKDISFRAVMAVLWASFTLACVLMYAGVPQWMDKDTTYQAVFFGILKDSRTPEEDLEELGLDQKYLCLAGTNAYMPEDEYPPPMQEEGFMDEFYENTSKFDILFFYLRHPVRLVRATAFAADNSAWIRPPYLGNSTTEPYEFSQRADGWSALRVKTRFLYTPAVILTAMAAVTIGAVVGIVLRCRKKRPLTGYVLLAVFCALWWAAAVLPPLANGEADIAKHMFLFVQLTDIAFWGGLLWTVCSGKRPAAVYVGAAAALCLLTNVQLPRDTVEIGRINSRPITWEIIEEYGDGTALLMADTIGRLPMGSTNLWEESQIRQYLNGGFLQDCFTEEERQRIEERRHRVLLPSEEKQRADSGDHTHFWHYTKAGAAKKAETAFGYTITDRVSLPDIQTAARAKRGATLLDTPYSGGYIRRMDEDGFFLNAVTEEYLDIRPTILYRLQ